MKRVRVGIIYGGRSNEHEVSLASAAAVLSNLDPDQYEIFPIYYQSVILNQEYIAIPIVYFMQSYLVGDLNIFDGSTLDILLSASSEKFNFSKIAIDPEKTRIEVFYSE